MNRFYIFVIPLCFAFNYSIGQSLKVNCIEKETKNPDSEYPIIINTCVFKKFKFKKISYPDFVGRYFDSEYEVYVLINKKYINTVNSNVFNKTQNELVSIINERVQKDFKKISSDTRLKECFTNLDTIPKYEMNDFKISFQNNEIWFGVDWGLTGVCRAGGGTTVSFKLSEIQKYLK